MVDLQLTRALIELVLFLEQSDDDVVDPDAAIAALEQLAVRLNLAEPDTKQILSEQLRTLSKEYPGAVEFVQGLPEALGLED